MGSEGDEEGRYEGKRSTGSDFSLGILRARSSTPTTPSSYVPCSPPRQPTSTATSTLLTPSTPHQSHPPTLRKMSALGYSIAKQIRESRGLYRFLKPLADRYANLAGYRAVGMCYDDLLIEENPTVQKALGRLTERESYERAYRHRVAHMQAMAHAPLPDGQHFPKEKDVRYLKPHVTEIERELTERADWDSVKVDRSSK